MADFSQILFSILCCAGPLALVGLFAIAISTYAVITGRGGSGRWQSPVGSISARISGVVGILTGLMFICFAVVVVMVMLLGGGNLQ